MYCDIGAVLEPRMAGMVELVAEHAHLEPIKKATGDHDG
jgi:hypothetical protein